MPTKHIYTQNFVILINYCHWKKKILIDADFNEWENRCNPSEQISTIVHIRFSGLWKPIFCLKKFPFA